MKKLIIGSLLTLTVVSGMEACKTSNYDANPNTDYKYAANPLDSTQHIVMIGSMSGPVNGARLVFSPAYYKVDSAGENRTVYASIMNDTVYYRKFQLTCAEVDVKDLKDTVIKNFGINYGFYDTVLKKRREYTVNSTGGNVVVKLVEDKNDGMRGYIAGNLVNYLPEPGDPNDIVKFDTVYFYFEKRK